MAHRWPKENNADEGIKILGCQVALRCQIRSGWSQPWWFRCRFYQEFGSADIHEKFGRGERSNSEKRKENVLWPLCWGRSLRRQPVQANRIWHWQLLRFSVRRLPSASTERTWTSLRKLRWVSPTKQLQVWFSISHKSQNFPSLLRFSISRISRLGDDRWSMISHLWCLNLQQFYFRLQYMFETK